ncbi:MAG: hypothetical protein U0T33_01440 [Bacteroidales bacterium]
MEDEAKKGAGFLGKGIHFLKRDVAIFAFFLLLSFFFWYLNSLRKEIELDMKYPVSYINPPRDRVVGGDIPQKLLLSIRGHGYSVVKLKLTGKRSPLQIDFSKIQYRRVPDGQPSQYYLVTSGLIPGFSKQFRSEFQILTIKPDTIFVSLERKQANRLNSSSTGKD